MSKERPDHADAQLIVQFYDLRREAVMRQSRDTMNTKFLPRTFEDILAVTKGDHPMNAAWRQVSTYWEMVYGMVKHDIVSPGYFLESNAEGLFIFAKMAPFLEQIRKDTTPRSLMNAEWVATQCPEGRALFETISQRVRTLAAMQKPQ